MRRWRWTLVALIVGLSATIAVGAEWQGFWGADEWPGTEGIEAGRWTELPICWGFNDSGRQAWTAAEKDVARAAVAEWNQAKIQDVANPLSGQIHEATEPACEGRATDIELKWAAPPGEGLVGLYSPERLADPIREAMGGDLCARLKDDGKLSRCNVVLLEPNNADGWFVDPTPTRDEEFKTALVEKCGEVKEMAQAKPGGPADGKQDLFTIIAHEFGHALGLIHTNGCDGDPRTPTDPTNMADDDGKLMWGGLFADRRGRGSSQEIGLSERRPLDASAAKALKNRYPTDRADRPAGEGPDLAVTSLDVQLQETQNQQNQTIFVVNIQSATVANQGNTEAKASTFQLVSVSSSALAVRTPIPSVPAGGEVTIEIGEQITIEQGNALLVNVIADVNDVVVESNEENNDKTFAIQCSSTGGVTLCQVLEQ